MKIRYCYLCNAIKDEHDNYLCQNCMYKCCFRLQVNEQVVGRKFNNYDLLNEFKSPFIQLIMKIRLCDDVKRLIIAFIHFQLNLDLPQIQFLFQQKQISYEPLGKIPHHQYPLP